MNFIDLSEEKDDSNISIELFDENSSFSVKFNNVEKCFKKDIFYSIFNFFKENLTKRVPLLIDYNEESGISLVSIIEKNNKLDLGYIFDIQKISDVESVSFSISNIYYNEEKIFKFDHFRDIKVIFSQFLNFMIVMYGLKHSYKIHNIIENEKNLFNYLQDFLDNKYIDLFDFMNFNIDNKTAKLRIHDLNIDLNIDLTYNYSNKNLILNNNDKTFIYENKNSFLKFFSKDLYSLDIEKKIEIPYEEFNFKHLYLLNIINHY